MRYGIRVSSGVLVGTSGIFSWNVVNWLGVRMRTLLYLCLECITPPAQSTRCLSGFVLIVPCIGYEQLLP